MNSEILTNVCPAFTIEKVENRRLKGQYCLSMVAFDNDNSIDTNSFVNRNLLVDFPVMPTILDHYARYQLAGLG